MSGSAADREKRIHLSINRLITHTVPDDPTLDEDGLQRRHNRLFDAVQDALARYGL